jgi:hypothetical protein
LATRLKLNLDNRPDDDPIEVPLVGVFPNKKTTTLTDAQAQAMQENYGHELGGTITIPPKNLPEPNPVDNPPLATLEAQEADK